MNMSDETYGFLNKPRYIRLQIRRTEAELEGLRYSMYPSAIRYDTDKVVSSPSDPMPRYAVRVDELEDKLKKLRLEYIKAQDAICDITTGLPYLEQEVIMLRYVAQWSWGRIAEDLGKTERWMFMTHRRAVRNIEKKLSTIEKVQ